MTAPNLPTSGLYAFPYSITVPDASGGTYFQHCPGMLLRDYFAAAAIPDAMRAVAAGQVYVPLGEQHEDAVARVAYDVADAMLAARARQTKPAP